MPEIDRETYILGNPGLSNWIYNFQRRTTPTPTPTPINAEEIDMVVIGGGITGTYLARRLTRQFPLSKILLIEKSDRIGGKLLSSYLGPGENSYGTALEYGGMRIFPSIQPRITKLIDLLDLKKVEVPYSVPKNLFSGRSRTFTNNELFPKTEEVYFVDESEKNEVVFNTINNNIYAKFQEYSVDPSPLYEPRVIAFKNPGLSGLCFHSEVTKGVTPISTENYRRYADITGYTSLFFGSGNYAALAYENISLNSFDATQYFVKGGYQQVPIGCVDTFTSISLSNLKNKRNIANSSILMNTELLNFTRTSDNKVQLTVSNGSENVTFKSKKLFVTVPIDKLNSIGGFPSGYYNKFEPLLRKLPLFKIFMQYDQSWWDSDNFNFSTGRNTTEMPINQVWFYNENTLMVYAVGQDAEFWGPQLTSLEQVGLIDVSSPYPSFLSYLMSFVKTVFKDYIDVPFPNRIGWKYWTTGGCFWNNLDVDFPDKSIYDIETEMINVFGEAGNVNYISNDISLNQGWTEGSIEIVDQFLNDKFNMNGILDISKL